MKNSILRYGIICGIIVSLLMLIPVSLSYHDEKMMDLSVWLGYASMLIAFSMLFVGVKTYRDKYNSGIISFGKAFKIGLLITLIASTIYTLTWLVESHLFFPEFMDRYSAHELAKLKDSGLDQQQINSQVADMAKMKEIYKNPLAVLLFTFLEIFPVGLVVSLFCAFILKRKPVHQVP